MNKRNYANPVTPSEMDSDHLEALRNNVLAFYEVLARNEYRDGMRVLDVAPETHSGIKPYLPANARVETLDIDASSGADFIADLCDLPVDMPLQAFDIVVCTEVLEHTLDPFRAVSGIKSLLKLGGLVAISTPFNFRIHGPLPDCWRFSEHGIRALFKEFTIEKLTSLETPGRPLMPIQYTMLARRVQD